MNAKVESKQYQDVRSLSARVDVIEKGLLELVHQTEQLSAMVAVLGAFIRDMHVREGVEGDTPS